MWIGSSGGVLSVTEACSLVIFMSRMELASIFPLTKVSNLKMA